MLTIAHRQGVGHQELDHDSTPIGPAGADSEDRAPLLAVLPRLAAEPLPDDPDGVEALRDIARRAIALLPADHPLAGADVTAVGTPLLVRLLVRVAPDLGSDIHHGSR